MTQAEKTVADKIDEGERASRYLNDPFLTGLLTDLREDAIRRVMHEPDRRDEAVGMLLAIETLRDTLKSRVTTGRLAAKRGA